MKHDIKKRIVYVGDPVCSWCYAFTDTFERIKTEFLGKIEFSYYMGGLVIDRDIKINAAMKKLLKKNWKEVEVKTGKRIKACEKIDGVHPMPYISDPACRAFMCIKSIDEELAYGFYKLVHQRFYEELKDISDENNLCDIAGELGIDKSFFIEKFRHKSAQEQVYKAMDKVKALGVRAFPALVAVDESGKTVLNQGIKPYSQLRDQISAWVDGDISADKMLPVL
ncbi:MAG: DsbA family protein [Desulfobacteraceae bacterium]